MAYLLGTCLNLPRCPHCSVDKPHLKQLHRYDLATYEGQKRFWGTYMCSRCAGVVLAEAADYDKEVTRTFPESSTVSADIPDRARAYLAQALDALASPAGAVMLAAASVDAMLKAKGLVDGVLNARIGQAAAQHMITTEMATWAHHVRIEANDQRHADTEAPLPTVDQARKCIDFAQALGQFLFVLPQMVTRGIESTKPK